MTTKNFKSDKRSLREIFNELVRSSLKGEELYARAGKVLSVDTEDRTATIELIGGAAIEGVLLQKTVAASGVLLAPSVGSVVLVGWVDPTTAYIAMYSELDTLSMRGSGFGGLIKIEQLTSKINELVAAFNAHTHTIPVINVVGSATAQATAAPVEVPAISSKASELQRVDFENTTITHGDGD